MESPVETSNTSVSSEGKKRKYTLRITRTLIDRLNRHLSYLKFIRQRKFSKRSWVLKALEEKIALDKEREVPDIPKRGVILLELGEELAHELDEKVELVRSVRGSYSIKSWMVDAIEEKLERDISGMRRSEGRVDNSTREDLGDSVR